MRINISQKFSGQKRRCAIEFFPVNGSQLFFYAIAKRKVLSVLLAVEVGIGFEILITMDLDCEQSPAEIKRNSYRIANHLEVL